MSFPDTPYVLSEAFDASFAAMKGWQRWKEPIQTFVESDDDRKRFLQLDANLSRCPMIVAAWDTTEPRWWVYSQQEWKCPLRVSIYVARERNRLSMDLLVDVVMAFFRYEHPQSTPSAPVSLIRRMTCDDPSILQFQPGIHIDAGADGQHKLLMSEVVIGLSLKIDPKLRPYT